MADQPEHHRADPDLPGNESDSVEQARTWFLEEKVKQLVERYALESARTASVLKKLIESQADFLPDDPRELLEYLDRLCSGLLDEVFAHFPKATDVLSIIEESNPIDISKELFIALEAQRLAPDQAMNPIQLQAAIRRFVEAFGQDLSTNAFEAIYSLQQFLFNVVGEASKCLSKPRARKMIEREDPHLLVQRISAVEYLSQDNVPLCLLPELEQHLAEFVNYLEGDRDHLIKTGLPQKCFRQCHWLYQQLRRLYDVKTTGSPYPRDELFSRRRATPERPAYEWVKYVPQRGPLGMESLSARRCVYEEADLLHGLNNQDAERIEASRAKLFDLKIKVLHECRKAVHERVSFSAPWQACLDLITAAIDADEADFLLRMDRFYIGNDARSDGAADASPKMIPGGLTNLLEVIGHCEKEIAIGTLDYTRIALGRLIRPNRAKRFDTHRRYLGNAYFWYYDHSDQPQLDSALDEFVALTKAESQFWAEFRKRANTAFESEFFVDVVVHTRVKRPLVEKFEPHLRTYANFVNTNLELGGQLPLIQVSGTDVSTQHTQQHRAGAKNRIVEKRSFTQPDLDAAIREYKARRASRYSELVAALGRGDRRAAKAAREMFGRNVIVHALGVRSPAMVTNSTVWQEIALDLDLDCEAKRGKASPKKKVGHKIALDDTAEARGDTTASQVDRNETIQLLNLHLAPDAAEATLDKLERGLMTDEDARKMVEEVAPLRS